MMDLQPTVHRKHTGEVGFFVPPGQARRSGRVAGSAGRAIPSGARLSRGLLRLIGTSGQKGPSRLGR